MRRLIALVVLASAALATAPAQACSWTPRSTSASLEAAEVAFVGRATVVQQVAGERRVSFDVLTVYKGSLPVLVEVATALSPVDCGVVFIPGEVYSVFATVEGERLRTSLPLGTSTGRAGLDGAGADPTARIVDGALESVGRPSRPRSGPIAAALLLLVSVAAALGARIGWRHTLSAGLR